MFTRPRFLAAALLALPLLTAALPARAVNLQTYAIGWSGEFYENSASASGFITLDLDLLPNPGDTGFDVPLAPIVTALTVTVTGSVAGNGTFGLADFTGWVFDTNGGVLNMLAELVGQPTATDPWGTSSGGGGGDFNLFPVTTTAPEGCDYFTLCAYSDTQEVGELMLLTNFTPVSGVPEPASLALLGAGLLGLGALRRRQA